MYSTNVTRGGGFSSVSAETSSAASSSSTPPAPVSGISITSTPSPVSISTSIGASASGSEGGMRTSGSVIAELTSSKWLRRTALVKRVEKNAIREIGQTGRKRLTSWQAREMYARNRRKRT